MMNEKCLSDLDWKKVNGMLPTIIQDVQSGQVLMMGYMDQDALSHTMATQLVTFYSRTKQRLWTKGERSGHYLSVVSIECDCDQDCLLILVRPQGPTCHKGTQSCFKQSQPESLFLHTLEMLIKERKRADSSSSYTSHLFHKGVKRIAQKVGEEGVETALAAMANDKDELINESADLIYHLLVLLQNQNVDFNEVLACLKQRHTMDGSH